MKLMTTVMVTVESRVSFDYAIRADQNNQEILMYAEKFFRDSARECGLKVISCEAKFKEDDVP